MKEIEMQRIAVLVSREMQKHTPDEVMTVEQVAEYLGLTPNTIRSKARSGELPNKKKFGRIYFSRKVITGICLT